MHFTKRSSSEKRIELKNKLKKQKILKFPGAYNPLTAKLIAEIGFEWCLYIWELLWLTI